MAAPRLRQVIKRLLSHASNDPTRFHLCGALVEEDGTTVCTDGHRMLIWAGRPLPVPGPAFVPATWMELAYQTLRGDDDNVALQLEGGRIELWVGKDGLKFSASLLGADRFPPWRQVMPKYKEGTACHVVVNRRSLAKALRHASVPAHEGVQITLDEALGAVRVLNEQKQWMPHATFQYAKESPPGGGRTIGLNPTYLLDAVADPADEVVTLTVAGPEDPVIVEGGAYRVVIMPMRV
jgi:DNA polymerase III sliding clamp (beta) subunit (PCNA family)